MAAQPEDKAITTSTLRSPPLSLFFLFMIPFCSRFAECFPWKRSVVSVFEREGDIIASFGTRKQNASSHNMITTIQRGRSETDEVLFCYDGIILPSFSLSCLLSLKEFGLFLFGMKRAEKGRQKDRDSFSESIEEIMFSLIMIRGDSNSSFIDRLIDYLHPLIRSGMLYYVTLEHDIQYDVYQI